MIANLQVRDKNWRLLILTMSDSQHADIDFSAEKKSGVMYRHDTTFLKRNTTSGFQGYSSATAVA
jgi:hypothetical protein